MYLVLLVSVLVKLLWEKCFKHVLDEGRGGGTTPLSLANFEVLPVCSTHGNSLAKCYSRQLDERSHARRCDQQVLVGCGRAVKTENLVAHKLGMAQQTVLCERGQSLGRYRGL